MESISGNGGCGPGETLVFVYGLLLRGESHHRYLNGARYLGAARTAAEYELVDLGGLPGMRDDGETAIDGELYAIPVGGLLYLDELEDAPEYFRRARVRLEDGRSVEGYLLPGRQAAPFPRIRSGNWRERG